MSQNADSVRDAIDRLRAVSGRERGTGQTVWVLNADVVSVLDYVEQLEAAQIDSSGGES